MRFSNSWVLVVRKETFPLEEITLFVPRYATLLEISMVEAEKMNLNELLISHIF